jgi:ATP-dependent DNA helicase DinG
MEYQIPEAVIRLKQGFGRLIRTTTDTGQVVVLDPRVRTKRYGSMFLESLPNARVVIDD